MAIIVSQISFFNWERDINILGDLERLKTLLNSIPDEGLMTILEKKRGHGRNDFPVRAMWNLLLAMFVFGHRTFAEALRELQRNIQMRIVCGFEYGKLPSSTNFSRFIVLLKREQSEVEKIFNILTEQLYKLLPNFGENLALDSKWVWSMAKKTSKREKPDARSETDAAWGTKEYRGIREDGSTWTKIEHCFGFKMNVIVDADNELPIAVSFGKASDSDIVKGKELIKNLKKEQPDIIQKCEHLMADRAYDDTDFILDLKSENIKAVIGKRNMWRTETEKLVPSYENIYYNEKGEIFCYSQQYGDRHEMRPAGYDAVRDTLRMKCSAMQCGITCREADTCTLCKMIRVPLSTDDRIFTQIARPSYKWDNLYNKRTAVERVFSRLDVSFGFETRRIRGMAKMKLLGIMGLIVINAMAVGRINEGKRELMRSLVRAA